MQTRADECLLLPASTSGPDVAMDCQFCPDQSKAGLAAITTANGSLLVVQSNATRGIAVRLRATLQAGDASRACCFVPGSCGALVAAAAGRAAVLVDLERKVVAQTFSVSGCRPRSMCIRPDQPSVLHVASSTGGLHTFDCRVRPARSAPRNSSSSSSSVPSNSTNGSAAMAPSTVGPVRTIAGLHAGIESGSAGSVTSARATHRHRARLQ